MIILTPTRDPRASIAEAIAEASRDPIARHRRERAGIDIPAVPVELSDDTRAKLIGVAIGRTMSRGE